MRILSGRFTPLQEAAAVAASLALDGGGQLNISYVFIDDGYIVI